MDKLFKVIITISIILVLDTVVSAQGNCPVITTCVKIKECKGAEPLLQNEQYLSNIEQLRCDSNPKGAKVEKICCPWKLTSRQREVTKLNLLPNTAVCGIQDNDRIIGGEVTELDEHPWLALIRYDKPKGWGFYCAGVLISSRYVLTAAHCVKGLDIPATWRLSQVRLGEWNISSPRDCISDDCSPNVLNIGVTEIIVHEDYHNYDENRLNDIALLRLSEDVPYNYFVRPICLPLTEDLRDNNYMGYDVEVAGWGKTENSTMSEVKLKLRLPIVSREKCVNQYKRANRTITVKQLCAGGLQAKDTCRGDSGGPLMARMPNTQNWFLVGIVSYGPSPCGTVNWPGVYTRVGLQTVDIHVDWIQSHMH